MSSHLDPEVLTAAVNRGGVHRLIHKPWQPVDLVEAVREGLPSHVAARPTNR